jgi:hypothetical protein
MRIHELVTEAFMPTSAFAGSDKNKLGPAGHLKGSMKRPASQGDLVGENFGNYYNENIASKVFSQYPDLTSEDDVLNAAWEHVVRDMGRKKAGHLFNYDEDFPSDLVSSYFYLQKKGVEEAFGPAATADLRKGSPAGSSWTSYMDWKDKANQREYQANILRDKEAHELALKLGGRPPSPGVLGTGIFANMNAQRFEQWLKQNPKALQAFSAYSDTQPAMAEDQSVSEKTDPDLCRSSKRLGSSDHSSCVSQGLRAHQSKGKGHTDGQGNYIKGKKIRGSKYGGPLPDQDSK